MPEPYLSLASFPAPTTEADALPRPLEGQHIVAVHGFATTPEVTWQRTGWVRQLQRAGAEIHLVTLPYHRLDCLKSQEKGLAETGPGRQVVVTWRQEGLLSSLGQALAPALTSLAGPVHLLGYSLGARICWQLALSHRHLVQSLTLGGMPLTNHLAQVKDKLAGACLNQALPQDLEAVLEASPLPLAALAAFTAQQLEPLNSQELPTCPTLLFAGSQDELTTGLPALVASLPHPDSVHLELAGRNHISALTSGQARRSASDFIGRHASPPTGSRPSQTVA